MFTEEWHSLDWEVSPRQSMKSVVLEMSVLFRVASFFVFPFICIFYEAAVQFGCCSECGNELDRGWRRKKEEEEKTAA